MALETTVKEYHKKVMEEDSEVKSVAKETGTSHPAGDKTRVIISKTSVATEFSIPEGMVPESKGIKEKDPEKPGGFITRFYYTCKTCGKQTQKGPVCLPMPASASTSIWYVPSARRPMRAVSTSKSTLMPSMAVNKL